MLATSGEGRHLFKGWHLPLTSNGQELLQAEKGGYKQKLYQDILKLGIGGVTSVIIIFFFFFGGTGFSLLSMGIL